MSPYLAYLLGILTVLLPIVILFVLSLNFNAIDNAWNSIFCNYV